MKIVFTDIALSSSFKQKIDEIKLDPNDYLDVVFGYALEQVKSIEDPKEAAKEFKRVANEFIDALVDRE